MIVTLLLASAIYLQPIGDATPLAETTAVRTALEGFYPAEVVILPVMPLPTAAYYAPRKRYRAEKLLDALRPKLPADGVRIIGLTTVDISTTNDAIYDWGIMGLGDLDGKASVISTFRCKKKAKSPAHARERLAKVAVHEVGHTLSLDHCPTPGCIMHDAMGKVATIDTEYDLCPRCRALLAKAGHVLAPAKIPWERP